MRKYYDGHEYPKKKGKKRQVTVYLCENNESITMCKNVSTIPLYYTS